MKLFKFFSIATIVLLSACASGGSNSSDADVAKSHWDDLGPIGERIVCEQYNAYGDDKEDEMYQFMTSPDNEYQLTPGVANESINILKSEC